MDWHSHFQQVFFQAWQKAGLPHHQKFLMECNTTRESVDYENEWTKQPYDYSPALEAYLLRSVYGFGSLHGKIFGEMLGVNDIVTKYASDWCGRFNLGISLFDYVCDESKGVDRLISLNVFQRFSTERFSNTLPLTPVEEFLSNLAGSVLDDLRSVSVRKEGFHKTRALLKLMKEMFDAEVFVSKTGVSADADLDKLNKALYCKSAVPFIVMAEFTARKADDYDPLLIKNARTIGKALGYCYWLIDDAKDVWIDLAAGQWNLFLLLAAKEDTQIFSRIRDASVNSRLLSIWEQSNHAQKMSNQIIKRLVDGIADMGLSKEVQQHTMGLVSASLWQWLTC